MMVAVPAATPFTVAVPVPGIDATKGSLLSQVPPDVVLLSVVMAPTHTTGVPRMVGSAFTFTVAVEKQVVGKVYVIVEDPPATPDMMPEEAPAVAIDVLPDVQVPPALVLVSVVVRPKQIVDSDGLITGNGLTVTVAITVPNEVV